MPLVVRRHFRVAMRVDDSFNGRRVDLHIGDTLEINLAENASTGYQWAIPKEPQVANSILKATRQTSEGRGALRRLLFQVIGAGTVDLELHYRKPWESSGAPARRFKLHIHVRS